MKISFHKLDLKLAHTWTIARSLKTAVGTGSDVARVILVELTDTDGAVGLGEAAPSSRYQENIESVLAFLEHVNPDKLSFTDVPGSMKYLETIAPKQFAAKGAVNIALLDGAARKAGKAVYDYLDLGFTENKHVTSFSIGIDKPEVIRKKVEEAANYPVLKLKVGSPDDKQNLAALRDVAPKKTVRVDGNEAWKTKEEALKNIEWLAGDGHIEFIEQPMPATSDLKDLAWLKTRSPLPIMADESYHHASDIGAVAEWAHSVNVKLVKTGGISGAYDALKAARKAGKAVYDYL
ncbi:MAG TPA: enolase C-terminal domain-like protein, partial [Verrucomicrobiae bacterium]|nr:enolase C-terminal domain-like protein [Verrucomicrobiae bacterium]